MARRSYNPAALLLLAATCALCQQNHLSVPGFLDFNNQQKLDRAFLLIPQASRAREHLKILTRAPHIAGSKEDKATAEYVASQFQAAGLVTTISTCSVPLSTAAEVLVEALDGTGRKIMSGPTREHVDAREPFQDDARIAPAYLSSSAAGEVTAPVVYANLARAEDFEELARRRIDVKGKVVLARYGQTFRGSKALLAQQHGAAALLLYSDTADDGRGQGGDVYPYGPWRPESAVQRGSILYMFLQPGVPPAQKTKGKASSAYKHATRKRQSQPGVATPGQPGVNPVPAILAAPLSWHDAAPILKQMNGALAPHGWQRGAPFSYHLGDESVQVHLKLRVANQPSQIWNVTGEIKGRDEPRALVLAGNHRDAWVYGAVDPGSGTAAMLEAARALGELAKKGWRPRRTILFASWDAEEQGLFGSTEWGRQHETELQNAVAYFNMDTAVSGPNFAAGSSPSLARFLRQVTAEVQSPNGEPLLSRWTHNDPDREGDARVAELGSGSDYTPFLEHLGVPSTDIASNGPYGVYHSVFDDYQWFTQNADPNFAYTRELAQVFGLEVLHMADAETLPYDFPEYARAILDYLLEMRDLAQAHDMKLVHFASAFESQKHFAMAADKLAISLAQAQDPTITGGNRNALLLKAEHDMLTPEGLPGRPWYRHTVFAPGVTTGYSSVVLPGVHDALLAGDTELARQQLAVLAAALERATSTLLQAAELH